LVVVGALAFALFAFAERRAVQPVIPPSFFRDRQLVVTYALEILIGMLEGSLFFVPAALVAAQHLTYAAAGAVAAVGAFCFVAVIPLAGRALDAVGSRAVLTAGSLLTAAGLALFAFGFGNLWLALLAMLVAGCGFGALLGAPTRYIVTNHVGAEQRASAVGLLSIFLIVGQIVGGSLGGGVAGSHGEPVNGYRVAYVVFTGIALAAALLTVALASRRAERARTQQS
ncbi:MAG: MFS transporter, partial [Candidatus Eremiobacteraeota bacterium]|nr:MFS transporter [Candidatus Eremiobacteraeota bacterium]